MWLLEVLRNLQNQSWSHRSWSCPNWRHNIVLHKLRVYATLMRLFEAPFRSSLAPAIFVQSEPYEIERRFRSKKVYEKIKILKTTLFNAKLYINIYVFLKNVSLSGLYLIEHF
jgi:hypothetical protein